MQPIKKETNPSSKLPIDTPITDEQLLKEITHFVDRVTGRHHLNDEQRLDAITDSFMITRRKMTDGTISNSNFEERKGYVFTICKSQVFQYLNKATKESNTISIDSDPFLIDMNDDNPILDIYPQIDIKLSIQRLKLILNEDELELVNLILEGYTYTEIKEKMIYNPGSYYYFLDKIKKKVVDMEKIKDISSKSEKNIKYKQRPIKATNLTTQEVLIFDNQPLCGEHFGKRKGIINAKLRQKNGNNILVYNEERYRLEYLY